MLGQRRRGPSGPGRLAPLVGPSEYVAAPRDAGGHEGLGEVQRRVRGPATGLKIAGVINCIAALPLLLAWLVRAVTMRTGSAHEVIVLGSFGVVFAGMGLLTSMGARKMMRLQSYGLAVTSAIIQLLPSPGFIIGAWIGIWALAVLTSKDVHRAFIDVSDAEGISVEGPVQKITLYVLAVTASIIFFTALLASLLHRQFPWLLILFGPPLVLLDMFVLGQSTGRPIPSPGLLWQRVKAEIGKRKGQNHHNAYRTRRMAVGSLVLIGRFHP